jgi:hypothetical protein
VVDLSHLWPMIDKGGLVFVLLFLVYAFVRGWIVPKWAYDKLALDCERMTQIALRTTDLSERAVSAGEKIIKEKREV